ncbi:glycosyltransferase family 2 protein [Brevibacillus sp. TJ4]|uniref:glycosyltransferase family 2 protein n=1 Tax=Brevibacillus sp. TJ4 TaxID=3234853 RepID=UPI0037D33BDA
MNNSRIDGLVSLVITNYNRAKYLVECLDSIRQQTYSHWEIILVDDASTDRSVEVAEQWREQYITQQGGVNQVVVHALPRNIGFAGALNTGLYLAQGEFIAIQDSDDYSHPLRFEKQVAFLRKRPDIELVGSNYYAFSGDAPAHGKLANWIRYGEEIKKVYGRGGHCVCHGTILFRGTLFDRIGGPTRRIVGAEDYEFIAKALNVGANIENIPDPLYYYRQHEGQRSTYFYGRKEKSNEQ